MLQVFLEHYHKRHQAKDEIIKKKQELIEAEKLIAEQEKRAKAEREAGRAVTRGSVARTAK